MHTNNEHSPYRQNSVLTAKNTPLPLVICRQIQHLVPIPSHITNWVELKEPGLAALMCGCRFWRINIVVVVVRHTFGYGKDSMFTVAMLSQTFAFLAYSIPVVVDGAVVPGVVPGGDVFPVVGFRVVLETTVPVVTVVGSVVVGGGVVPVQTKLHVIA